MRISAPRYNIIPNQTMNYKQTLLVFSQKQSKNKTAPGGVAAPKAVTLSAIYCSIRNTWTRKDAVTFKPSSAFMRSIPDLGVFQQ